MKQYPSLDEMILQGPPGALLTPMCAKEVFILRTIGSRWQGMVRTVVDAQKDLARHPGVFGDYDMKLYVTRKYTEGIVISTVGQEITLPRELFTWPL